MAMHALSNGELRIALEAEMHGQDTYSYGGGKGGGGYNGDQSVR